MLYSFLILRYVFILQYARQREARRRWIRALRDVARGVRDMHVPFYGVSGGKGARAENWRGEKDFRRHDGGPQLRLFHSRPRRNSQPGRRHDRPDTDAQRGVRSGVLVGGARAHIFLRKIFPESPAQRPRDSRARRAVLHLDGACQAHSRIRRNLRENDRRRGYTLEPHDTRNPDVRHVRLRKIQPENRGDGGAAQGGGDAVRVRRAGGGAAAGHVAQKAPRVPGARAVRGDGGGARQTLRRTPADGGSNHGRNTRRRARRRAVLDVGGNVAHRSVGGAPKLKHAKRAPYFQQGKPPELKTSRALRFPRNTTRKPAPFPRAYFLLLRAASAMAAAPIAAAATAGSGTCAKPTWREYPPFCDSAQRKNAAAFSTFSARKSPFAS